MAKSTLRRNPLVAGASLVVFVALASALSVILAVVLPGDHVTLSLITENPVRWLPELTLIGISFILAIVGVSLSILVQTAMAHQASQGTAVALMSLSFMVAGLRTVHAATGAVGAFALGAGALISLLTLSSKRGEFERELEDWRKKGRLRDHLDEASWRWSGAVAHELRADLSKSNSDKGESSGVSLLRRAHWLAPGSGMLMARYFGGNMAAAIGGFAFVLLSLLMARQVYMDLALLQRLRAWDRERGEPLKLEDGGAESS